MIFWATLFVAAECLIALSTVETGLIVHAVIVIGMMIGSQRKVAVPDGDMMPGIAVGSILRLLTFLLPPNWLPIAYWNLVVALPMFASIFMTRYVPNAPWRLALPHTEDVSPSLRAIVIGVVGAVLILVLAKPIAGAQPQNSAELIAFICGLGLAAVVEEFIFRGIILRQFQKSFGSVAVPLVTILSSAIYLTSQPLFFLLAMIAFNAILTWYVFRTNSVWSAAFARMALSISLFSLAQFVAA